MDELAKRFAELAEKYGPSVVDAAKEAARVEAYSTLVSSVIWVAIAAGCAWGAGRLHRAMKNCDDEFLWFPIGCLLAMAALAGMVTAWIWIDPWTWAAINHPELYIAKKVIKL